jgi:Type IV secretion system pilin
MKNLAKKALTGILLVSPFFAFGAIDPNVPRTNITSLAGVEGVITKIVNWITGLFFVLAMLGIFYSAFLYLTAAGDPEKITKAKNQLMYSIIAIGVALLAGTMKYIVQSILS